MRASKQRLQQLLQKKSQPRNQRQAKQKRLPKNNLEVVAILHNIRSLQNVGAMFRTADAAGIDGVILTGYTPSPIDILGNVRKEFSKTALGAERSVQWKSSKNISITIIQLKKSRHHIYAIEEAKGAKDIFSYKITKPCAFIVGNEVTGLSRSVLAKCDAVLSIPMRGKKESLNVSVAFGIAAYAVKKS
jgi:23S rRNA (guanosine2251-2'-O)-methyltransferase